MLRRSLDGQDRARWAHSLHSIRCSAGDLPIQLLKALCSAKPGRKATSSTNPPAVPCHLPKGGGGFVCDGPTRENHFQIDFSNEMAETLFLFCNPVTFDMLWVPEKKIFFVFWCLSPGMSFVMLQNIFFVQASSDFCYVTKNFSSRLIGAFVMLCLAGKKNIFDRRFTGNEYVCAIGMIIVGTFN
jgi:hypothetical protein